VSNFGQIATTVIGAIIGAVTAGPGGALQGALYGSQLGYAAGTFIFPTQLPPIQGPRITDHQTTSSTLGDPIAIGYGTFPVAGTVIFLADVVEHSSTTSSGGKGPPRQKQTTYSYTQSIAIGLCETTSMLGVNNPILGIQRIWENGELVYDTRGIQPGETTSEHGHDSTVGTYQQRIEANAKYAATFVLYTGTETQGPDPTIELQQGVGTTPSYRGLAYIVYPDRLLRQDQGVRHPTFKFEILAAGHTEAQVIDPTYLPGGEHSLIQIDVVSVDWTNLRYYIWSGASAKHTIMAFDLLTNTQLAENDSFWDKTASADANFVILSDGTLVVQWVEASHSYIIKMDPVTLAPIGGSSTYPLTSALWQTWALTTVNFGAGPVDYLAASGAFAKVTITDCSTLISTTVFTYTDHPRVVAGLSEGGNGVFWVISNTPRIFGPTGGDIAVHKIVVESGSITNTLKHTFAPADIDASWGYITTIGDMILDPSDGHIIMRVAHSLDGKFVKFNGEDGTIDWATDIALGANYDYAFGHAGILNNAIWFTDDVTVGHYFSLNASTGEITSVDISGLIAGATDGAAATNSAILGGAILTNINSDSVPGWSLILPSAPVAGTVDIADIVADLCERSGLTDHDTSSIDQTVEGFVIVTTPMNARDAIVPLRSVGFFDSVESGDTLKFVKRGAAPAMTLGVDDIGAIESDSSNDPPPANSVTIAMESDLPQQIRVSYMSPSRNYENGQQLSPMRFDTLSQNIVDVQLGGICITDDQAAQATEILWNDAWEADHTFTFAVDVSKAALEPTDVVLLPMQGTLYRVRIQAIDDASQVMRTITAVTDDDGNYVSQAVAQSATAIVTTMQFHAESSLILMDSPLLRDANDTGRVSAPMYSAVVPVGTDSWTGAGIYESDDGGSTYLGVATADNKADSGLATTALADVANPFITDTVSTLTVEMSDASTLPSTITDAQLLAGGNAAALIDADGAVEILQFRDVTVIDSGTVELSYFLRGRRGSESMTGNHAVGSRLVMLGPAITQQENLNLSDLAKVLQWKAVGATDTLDDATAVPFTSNGRSLMPRAPWNTRTTIAGSDILINADRRSRIENESAISFVSPTMALNEDMEAYEVDIYDAPGTSVLRTLSGTSLPILYSAADITADFGGMPADITLAVYQMSAQVGRGFTHKVNVGVPT